MKNSELAENKGSSIMAGVVSIIDRFIVYQQVVRLQRAGKTVMEIAESLGLTTATVQHMISINLPVELLDEQKSGLNEKQRLELAYQMRRLGKSMAEISDRLQVNIPQVRRMIHRHSWILRHVK
ncbi:MAG TPA: hypothetical protein VJ302_21480 [Blastocatellia bacterium]|nr:hypothetical protein [Blastocatellia bacterium]